MTLNAFVATGSGGGRSFCSMDSRTGPAMGESPGARFPMSMYHAPRRRELSATTA